MTVRKWLDGRRRDWRMICSPSTSPRIHQRTATMTMRSIFGPVCCGALLLAGAGLAASEKPHFESQLRDGAITIDGRYDDWYGSLQPFEQAPVAIQFLNDKDFLYMRLTASASVERREILRQGFTVWFDPAGGTKKHLGIRYPVVERGTGGDEDGRGGSGRGGGGGGMGGRGGGGHGGGGGRGDDHEAAKPLKGWATVAIAPAPAR